MRGLSNAVYVSYSRSDASFARRLLDRLVESGFSVVDECAHLGPRGFLSEPDLILDARVVVVIWSKAASRSIRVLQAVERGSLTGRLLPVVFGEVDLPSELQQITTVRFGANVTTPRVRALSALLDRRLGVDDVGLTNPRGGDAEAPEPIEDADLDDESPPRPVVVELRQPVFISYSRSDQAVCDRLAEHLAFIGVAAFVDRSLSGGDRWKRQIVRQIDECELLVVLVSRHSNASENVAKEVGRAVDRGKKIFPLFLEATQLAEELAFDLGGVHHRDISDDVAGSLSSVAREIESLVGGRESASPSRIQTSREPTSRNGRGTKGHLVWIGVLCLSAALTISNAATETMEDFVAWVPAVFVAWMPFATWTVREWSALARPSVE